MKISLLIMYMCFVSEAVSQTREYKISIQGADTSYWIPFSATEIKNLRIKLIESESCIIESQSLEREIAICDSINQTLSAYSDSIKLTHAILRDRARVDSTTLRTFQSQNLNLIKDKEQLNTQNMKLEKKATRWQNVSIGGFVTIGVAAFTIYLLAK